jgi:UDP-2-acetamido-3-amino-2,3-dideoxy-glucuronate N-acetyltransferase
VSAFIHPNALCETANVGSGTRIWAFAHVLPGAIIGVDCNICDHVFIENDVTIGDRVTIKCGVQVWDGIHIEDDVFVGPNVSFTNDPFPRSKAYPQHFSVTRISAGASVGAGAVILPGIRLGQNSMVGAGAVVTRDVPPNAVVVGNPAHITGYVDAGSLEFGHSEHDPALPVVDVNGVVLQKLVLATDLRGSLMASDFAQLPFVPKRVFTVFDVPSRDVRGEHAHRVCSQLLVCIKGSVSCIVDDGANRSQIKLDRPDVGLFIPPLVWGTQYNYSSDAILLVLASEEYNADDYIRDYQEFLDSIR